MFRIKVAVGQQSLKVLVCFEITWYGCCRLKQYVDQQEVNLKLKLKVIKTVDLSM